MLRGGWARWSGEAYPLLDCKQSSQGWFGSGVVWCGVVWCGVVWCGVVWCGVVWCGVVWCGVVCRRRCYQMAMAGMSCIRVLQNREGCVSKRALCVVCGAPVAEGCPSLWCRAAAAWAALAPTPHCPLPTTSCSVAVYGRTSAAQVPAPSKPEQGQGAQRPGPSQVQTSEAQSGRAVGALLLG